MVKDKISSATLQKLCLNYETQAGEIRALKERLRKTTRQRDQANVRNAELRQHIARYQEQLALARREWAPRKESAWDRTCGMEAL